ncbi:MAG: phosphate ABC transporter permease [Trichodesmium sp. St16_bin4-tuft]|nr:phosphate ABC transporter permease [Trichodesmium sp. MAG_R01]MDE5072537.1 phosphate ABC transporter permease [Trichodesmium sp. St5_bin8]MDE5078148.1 phosphate ABC transporter permease [Trichodesmium sp. St2_bin6]MDE5097966.1 phosphate ABC transporter permease [Trichodesmium sp. St16_bin4-tuft]MDE5102098.1 phosphate ABC transporter permease [Trichodesmium sp. St19_bin2]
MLVPLTRKTFEQLIPIVATGDQYKYYWGRLSEVLKRALISAVSVLVIVLINVLVHDDGDPLFLLVGITAGLYWFWGPVLLASFQNVELRRYPYSGLWQGKVFDVYLSEEVVGQEEKVNKKGELIIVENLEQRINLELQDKTGFKVEIQAPLRRYHQGISRGQIAVMLVMSYQQDLEKIVKYSDVYLPTVNLWVSNYPYLRKDVFVEVINQVRSSRRKNKQHQQTNFKFE